MKVNVIGNETDKNNIKYIDTTELFKLYRKDRDNKIRDELINRHLYIAEILTKKYLNRGIDYDDIYQVASLGLIYAVERFDITKGYEFNSFATPTIIGEIKKYFRDKSWIMKVPRRIQELSKKITNTKAILSQKLDKMPTVSNIAEYLDCTEEEILEALEANKAYTPHSLDVYYDNDEKDNDFNLLAVLGKNDEALTKIEDIDFINTIIDKLDDKEKQIIKDRYFYEKTQAEIAKNLGVSQMTVSRMEKNIINKFKKELDKNI
ncbi:SigB/SigF/SigG family RNA polymerase sigma factor [Abyssisolibacter fermentans]|uniref:SigB/SigF/SigG family RNA polymerase sigma factor n=1 Tax=Abyssisolibacter fermentans TaxID=1766203 RepID=UPI0008379047|nr:SigB/SigF/SigG family RNA polymerase sigma factor [Abyssisolibacter fermentans]